MRMCAQQNGQQTTVPTSTVPTSTVATSSVPTSSAPTSDERGTQARRIAEGHSGQPQLEARRGWSPLRRLLLPGLLLPGLLLPGLLLMSACSKEPPQGAQLPEGKMPVPVLKEPTAVRTGGAVSTPKPKPVEDSAKGPYGKLPPPALIGGLPAGELVAAANLDGEGPDEIVVWGPGGLTLWAQGEEGLYQLNLAKDETEQSIQGAPAKAVVADLDGDKRDDVLLAWGMTRGALRVPVTLTALRLKGDSGGHKRQMNVLFQLDSERPDVVGLSLARLLDEKQPQIILSFFDSKYFTTARALSLNSSGDPLQGPLQSTNLGHVRMATSWAVGKAEPNSRPTIILGRPYGEEKLAPGDIFVFRGEDREVIPSALGVRSVTIGDGDGDKSPEVYFGDGWHFEYGTKARGRLSVAKKEGGKWLTFLIEDTKGQYEIGQIVIDDVDDDGKPEVIAAGSQYINLYWKEGREWFVRKVCDGSQFAVARTSKGKALVVAGQPIKLVSLADGRKGGAPVSKEVSAPGTLRQSTVQPATP